MRAGIRCITNRPEHVAQHRKAGGREVVGGRC
jgi:hypothetical protein